jgi:uncharacterized membrane protein YccC
MGGMWAVAATVFVFRETRLRSLSAGIARLIATCVSFALCLLYLLLFPFTPVGMAALIAIGTLVLALLGRRDDIITAGITTVVVMVVAAMSPADAWQQPLLRLADTVVGIAVVLHANASAHFCFISFSERRGESSLHELDGDFTPSIRLRPAVEDEHDANPDRRSRRPDPVGQPCGNAPRIRV